MGKSTIVTGQSWGFVEITSMFYRHSDISFLSPTLTFYSLKQMVHVGLEREEGKRHSRRWQPHKQACVVDINYFGSPE